MKPFAKDFVGSAALLLLLCTVTGALGASLHELLPDPSNCSAFFLSHAGASIRLLCPSGLHFHAAEQRCDYPSKAGCASPHIPHNDSALCPLPGPNHLELYKHPQNCSKFRQCVDGRLVDHDCPAGLHFNDVLKLCDYPERAQCAFNISIEVPGPVVPPTDESVCPPPGEGDLVLLPDPKNCSQYLVCDNGKLVVLPCPPGLLFNPDVKVCELPSDAGCKESSSTQKQFLDRVEGLAVKRIFGSCPPLPQVHLIRLPHPDDCSMYLVCDNGALVERSCPPNQHFNPHLFVCDFPWAAGCEKRKRV